MSINCCRCPWFTLESGAAAAGAAGAATVAGADAALPAAAAAAGAVAMGGAEEAEEEMATGAPVRASCAPEVDGPGADGPGADVDSVDEEAAAAAAVSCFFLSLSCQKGSTLFSAQLVNFQDDTSQFFDQHNLP